jgi:hypothetical protein
MAEGMISILTGIQLIKDALGNKPASQSSGSQMLGIDHRSADQA